MGLNIYKTFLYFLTTILVGFICFWWSVVDPYDRYLLTECAEAKAKLLLQDSKAKQYVRNSNGVYIRMGSLDFLEHNYTKQALRRLAHQGKQSLIFSIYLTLVIHLPFLLYFAFRTFCTRKSKPISQKTVVS